ncbi:unnamed protein product [Amoebophrya sp. A25]|nr:unnamed protein product [Amoebophrya sp. A25]|eukprot:GSA25T00000938001.1
MIKVNVKKNSEQSLLDRIRAFQRSAENGSKKCADCPQMGPTYVCYLDDYRFFVCTNCSGIHRELNHKVKGISVSKWTPEEVDDIVNGGGNKRASAYYGAEWNPRDYQEPDSGDSGKLREFIRLKYVDKRWAPRGAGYSNNRSKNAPRGGDTGSGAPVDFFADDFAAESRQAPSASSGGRSSPEKKSKKSPRNRTPSREKTAFPADNFGFGDNDNFNPNFPSSAAKSGFEFGGGASSYGPGNAGWATGFDSMPGANQGQQSNNRPPAPGAGGQASVGGGGVSMDELLSLGSSSGPGGVGVAGNAVSSSTCVPGMPMARMGGASASSRVMMNSYSSALNQPFAASGQFGQQQYHGANQFASAQQQTGAPQFANQMNLNNSTGGNMQFPQHQQPGSTAAQFNQQQAQPFGHQQQPQLPGKQQFGGAPGHFSGQQQTFAGVSQFPAQQQQQNFEQPQQLPGTGQQQQNFGVGQPQNQLGLSPGVPSPSSQFVPGGSASFSGAANLQGSLPLAGNGMLIDGTQGQVGGFPAAPVIPQQQQLGGIPQVGNFPDQRMRNPYSDLPQHSGSGISHSLETITVPALTQEFVRKLSVDECREISDRMQVQMQALMQHIRMQQEQLVKQMKRNPFISPSGSKSSGPAGLHAGSQGTTPGSQGQLTGGGGQSASTGTGAAASGESGNPFHELANLSPALSQNANKNPFLASSTVASAPPAAAKTPEASSGNPFDLF